MAKIIEFPGGGNKLCAHCHKNPTHPAQYPGDVVCGLCEICCIIAIIEEDEKPRRVIPPHELAGYDGNTKGHVG